MLYRSLYSSPLGEILLVADEAAVVGLWLEGQEFSIEEEISDQQNPVLGQAKDWLNRYFAGQCPLIDELPLAPRGNVFRQRVWGILRNIPYGQTITYGEIAQKIALIMNKPRMSSQAIGNAVGHNPISIIIPCHRVVGKNGNLTGYAGGLDKKVKLLQIEGVEL